MEKFGYFLLTFTITLNQSQCFKELRIKDKLIGNLWPFYPILFSGMLSILKNLIGPRWPQRNHSLP